MNKLIDIRLIVKVLGVLIIFEGLCMLIPAIVAFIYKEDDLMWLLLSAGIAIVLGIIAFFAGKINADSDGMNKREGYLIVSLVWVLFSFIGLLPFYLSGYIPSFTDAFFETMSGFTTTGSSVLTNIESLPHGLLFWRSMTNWIGGMGILVLTVAIVPFLGEGAIQLFMAESTGPLKDKLHPRVSGTAKRLWGIYVSLTLIQVILLYFGGMGWFDSVCHSFSSMATGGFSTKQAGIAHWDSPVIQYILIAFMIIGGTNFSLYYYIMKGKWRKVFKNEEFRLYWFFILVFSCLVTLSLFLSNADMGSVESVIRSSVFQVVSLLTTTGFATANYIEWGPFVLILIVMIFFIGGSAGSTSGGIKVIRISLMIKNCYYEFHRLIHPNAVIPVRYNERTITSQMMNTVVAFIVLYIFTVLVGSMLLSFMGVGAGESLSAAAACMSSIGPGFGEVGPMGSYAFIPDAGKWLLSILMFIGRLELFTVLLLFLPSFWK